MINVHWQHIILDKATFSGHRVARVREAGGSPVIYSQGYPSVTDTWTPNTTETGLAQPSILYTDGFNYNFMFWSLSWTVGPDSMGFPSTDLAPRVALPEPDTYTLEAKAWYVWDLQGGGGYNGIYLDAFDMSIGDFIDPDFVTVSPDLTRAITAAANDGLILTSGPQNLITMDEAITADDHIYSISRVYTFSSWQIQDQLTFPSPHTDEAHAPGISATDPQQIIVHATKGGSILFALAFYGGHNIKPRTAPFQPARPELTLAWTEEGWTLSPRGSFHHRINPPVGPSQE